MTAQSVLEQYIEHEYVTLGMQSGAFFLNLRIGGVDAEAYSKASFVNLQVSGTIHSL